MTTIQETPGQVQSSETIAEDELGVRLRLTDNGTRIHLGASGLVAVTGELGALEAANHTPNWEYESTEHPGETWGVALYNVGDAVNPGDRASRFDRDTQLHISAGDATVPAPDRVRCPVLSPESPTSRTMAGRARELARNANTGGKLPLDEDLQVAVDSDDNPSGLWESAEREQRKRNDERLQERLSAVHTEVRHTESTGRRLFRGQADVAQISALLEGGGEAIEPATHLLGTGGQGLFYPGAENALVGPSGSGKSWATMEQCRQSLLDGGTVLYLDFEDRAESVVRRMRALGCGQALVDERFIYVSPEIENGQIADIDAILTDWAPEDPGHFADIIVDGISAVLGLSGVDDNNAAKYAEWRSRVLVPLANTGACVTTVDHTTKAAQTKGGAEATGTMQKRAQASGAVFTVHPLQTPRPGDVGSFALYLTKDKPGDVIRRSDPETGYVGRIEVDSREDLDTNVVGVATRVRFIPFNPDSEAAPGPTDLMPELDAAIHDVFPPDETPHTVNGRRNPALPDLGELLWLAVRALVGTDEGAQGLTKSELFSRVRELAPEATREKRTARLDERLTTQTGDRGFLERKGQRYYPHPDRSPRGHKVPEVLEALLEHMGARQDLDGDDS